MDNHYRQTLLAKGGTGEVYLVEDMKNHTKWVEKSVVPGLNPAYAQRTTELEKRALDMVRDLPHVIQPYEPPYQTDNICMEYLIGMPLNRIMREVAPERSLHALLQTGYGLRGLHARGIVHRDLKPGNIFVSLDDAAKIGDFGLARILQEPEPFDNILAEHIAVGTPQYMSPEHLKRGEEVPASDWFAFGAMVYEACVHKRFHSTRMTGLIALRLQKHDDEMLAPRKRELRAKGFGDDFIQAWMLTMEPVAKARQSEPLLYEISKVLDVPYKKGSPDLLVQEPSFAAKIVETISSWFG